MSKSEIKIIKLRPSIESHDFYMKVNKCRDYLVNGNNIKLIMKFIGREIIHIDKGINDMNRYCEELSDVSKVDNSIKSEGSMIEVFLISKIKKR